MSIIKLENVTKVYGGGKVHYAVKALDNISLSIEKGEFVSIMGPSGSGKTTLLNIIGCMDILTQGNYYLQDREINNFSIKELSKIRGNVLSFVFQNFSLLKTYSVYDNIELPLIYSKLSKKKKREKIFDVMKQLNIEELYRKKPTQISGGQQQRVAIARSLVCNAEVILADEPTGALDRRTGDELLETFLKINESGKTILIVTHDHHVAEITKRTITLEDGKILLDV